MKNLGLYIHIPFCKTKCYYCDFYSEVGNIELIRKFILAFENEIQYFIDNFKICKPEISTLYIGGGTPSLLEPKDFNAVINIIKKYFILDYLQEVTIELNPESVNEEKIICYKNLFGLNGMIRLSLGVQSFNNKVLKYLGRIHDVRRVYYIVELFQKFDIENYSFDIIFGTPYQNLFILQQDLITAVKLQPKHMSCYALTIEEGTKLCRSGFKVDPDLQADMYNVIVDICEKNDYIIYEISNFAKRNYECKHNLNYWYYGNYIGLGPSAVSFVDNKRITNKSKVIDYINSRFTYFVENVVDDDIIAKEKIMLLLRTTKGIKIDNPILDKYRCIVEKLLKDKKFILTKDGNISISNQYRFLINQILVDFF
ncbi:MAG: radical SAM family heme chaperone HemW [Endomicrobia bacterium]|nr:radical SAM family heme chaperone HemW [Endomicrobiia bacterium]